MDLYVLNIPATCVTYLICNYNFEMHVVVVVVIANIHLCDKEYVISNKLMINQGGELFFIIY